MSLQFFKVDVLAFVFVENFSASAPTRVGAPSFVVGIAGGGGVPGVVAGLVAVGFLGVPIGMVHGPASSEE